MSDEPDIKQRLRDISSNANREVTTAAIAEIERLEYNQITGSTTAIAQAAALQAQRADAAEKQLQRKGEQFTKALMTAMHLIDQLVTENGRLCAASSAPPPLQLFTAKRNFETEMKKLLGSDESARAEKREVESDTNGEST